MFSVATRNGGHFFHCAVYVQIVLYYSLILGKAKSLYETITGMKTYAESSSDVGINSQTGLLF